MTEAKLWQRLRPLLLAVGDATRHTDATPGIPDVSFGIGGQNGWLELKYYRSKPNGALTAKMLGLTREQLLFLRQRGATGGNCWLLAEIAGELYLWIGKQLPLDAAANLLDSALHVGPARSESNIVAILRKGVGRSGNTTLNATEYTGRGSTDDQVPDMRQ